MNCYKIILNSKNVFVFLFLSILIISCNKNKDEIEDYEDYVASDKSKLGIEVDDQELGIKFYPPKDWELRQTSISKKIESRGVKNNNENFIYEPTYVFFNSSVGGLLSVGKITTSDSTLSRSAKLNYYKGLLSQKYKDNNLMVAKFIYSKIYFTQFHLQKENLTSFKIVFENSVNSIIQFDYTLPSNEIDSNILSVKASIGSIRLK